MTFDGTTYEPQEDQQRLTSQLDKVRALMLDGEWRSLVEIAEHIDAPLESTPGISARLRDLKKKQFGKYEVERRRRFRGVFEYRVSVPRPAETLFDMEDIKYAR